jgi:hypothetical protein
MGLRANRFYFKDGLPKVSAIKDKFTEITGLSVSLQTTLFLSELVTDRRAITHNLSKSQDILNRISSDDFEGDKTEARRDVTGLGRSVFYCASFNSVQLGDYQEEKSFYLETGIDNESLYFFEALIKTMLEIGGHSYNHHISPPDAEHVIADHLESYHPHEKRWKKIKKWDEMSDSEKAFFKSPYS